MTLLSSQTPEAARNQDGVYRIFTSIEIDSTRLNSRTMRRSERLLLGGVAGSVEPRSRSLCAFMSHTRMTRTNGLFEGGGNLLI
jgi:hypothetical protein